MAGSIARKLSLAGRIILLSVVAVLIALPILQLFLSSLKSVQELMSLPPTFLPKKVDINHYRELFALYPFGRSYVNSLIVTLGGTSTLVLTSTIAGYVFGKFKFPDRNLMFIIVLATYMIPLEIKIIPLCLIVKKMALIDTYFGILVPGLVGAFGIFLMRQFIQEIPEDYLSAGQIDGLSEFKILINIIIPLSIHGMSLLVIIEAIGLWQSLLWPMIVITSNELRTLPMLLSAMSYRSTRFDLPVSAAAMASFVPLVIFFLFQKQLVMTASLSGLK